MESNFIKVAEKSEIAPGKMKTVTLEGKEIIIGNVNGNFYAIGSKCTHADGDLSKGNLEGNTITCPKHHAKFDVTNGKVVSHPKMGLFHAKSNDVITHQVKIEQENVMVEL